MPAVLQTNASRRHATTRTCLSIWIEGIPSNAIFIRWVGHLVRQKPKELPKLLPEDYRSFKIVVEVFVTEEDGTRIEGRSALVRVYHSTCGVV